MVENSYSEAVKIVKGVLDFSRSQMGLLMGYEGEEAVKSFLKGTRFPKASSFKTFIIAGFNPGFFVDQTEPMLKAGESLPLVKEKMNTLLEVAINS